MFYITDEVNVIVGETEVKTVDKNGLMEYLKERMVNKETDVDSVGEVWYMEMMSEDLLVISWGGDTYLEFVSKKEMSYEEMKRRYVEYWEEMKKGECLVFEESDVDFWLNYDEQKWQEWKDKK